MKKFFFGVLLLLCSFSAFSQKGELVMRSGMNFSFDLADSLLYIFPEYHVGLVLFNNGDRSQALLNINTLFQGVYFIDEAGDTLAVANEKDISSVYVSNRLFKKFNSHYIEVLNPRSVVSIGLCKILKLSEPVKQGAYGSTSNTSSISTVDYLSDGTGAGRYLNKYLNVPWKYSHSLYLIKGDRTFLSTKKSFLKLFPSLSSFISEYLEQNKVDFNRMEDVQPLLDLCLEKL